MQDNGELFDLVLLVEDDAAHALLIERALRGSVVSVVRVPDVRSAKAILQDRKVDLILSDLNLPDHPSESVVSALLESADDIPLVVLTSSSSLGDGVAAMRAGAQDFLVKNFDSSFKDVLRLALSRIHSTREIEREKAKLARDRDLLRIAIENSHDGLAVATRAGEVTYCNTAFQQFLTAVAAPNNNLLQIPPASLLRGREVTSLLAEHFKSLEAGGIWTTEIVTQGDGDGAFELSVSVVAGEGMESSVLLWLRDVRERRRRERFQRDILSTTTHDLKGPLGAISISCDVLLEKPFEDQRATALLERIAASASSAIHLIEEFLSVRRIEEGSFILRPILQPLEPICRRSVETFRLAAETRGILLEVAEPVPGVAGCVDALGLERVLSNLVSNALKFTPRGGRVVISANRRDGGVALSVKDTGSGMEPADAQRIFQRFTRLAEHSTAPGSGLGLFIVKNIVSAHGGTVDVTSAPGRGTTFDVFLPDVPPINERGEVLCLGFA